MDTSEPVKNDHSSEKRGVSINIHAPCDVINIAAADHIEFHIYRRDQAESSRSVPRHEEAFTSSLSSL